MVLLLAFTSRGCGHLPYLQHPLLLPSQPIFKTCWKQDKKKFLWVLSFPRAAGSRSEEDWQGVHPKQYPQHHHSPQTPPEDLGTSQGPSAQLARAVEDTIRFKWASQTTLQVHSPLCPVPSFFTPHFLTFLHSTSSFPLSFSLKLGQLFPKALLIIAVKQSRTPQGCYPPCSPCGPQNAI